MKEIYMNSINGDIIMNMEDYDIIDKVREDDNSKRTISSTLTNICRSHG